MVRNSFKVTRKLQLSLLSNQDGQIKMFLSQYESKSVDCYQKTSKSFKADKIKAKLEESSCFKRSVYFLTPILSEISEFKEFRMLRNDAAEN